MNTDKLKIYVYIAVMLVIAVTGSRAGLALMAGQNKTQGSTERLISIRSAGWAPVAMMPNPPLSAEAREPAAVRLGIADLFILDRLFRNGPEQLLSAESTTIGDLLLLNQIFNSGRLGDADNEYSLAQLFILDKLFSQNGSSLLDPNSTTLGDLLILDRIFNSP